VHEENLRLSERLRAAEIELSETREQAREAARLRALLGLRDRMGFETTVAEVIAMEGGPWASMITIDKGSSHGLKLNAPVICPAGVLGRVVAIGPLSAKVQLLLDRDSGVGVLIDRSRATGVLGGQRPDQLGAGGELPLRYVPVLADVVVGDVVVTSGLDQIFPKGLVVGHVSRVQANAALLKEVWVVPAAQFDQLEEVFVLQARAELPPPNATVQ
jgi:rod shape-determining protein MreC